MPDSDRLLLWPRHLKPLPGELPSSWIVRLAHAHGYKAEQACRLLLGWGQPMWNRDIDKQISPELRKALKDATAVTDDQLDRAELRSLEGYICEHVNINGLSKWIVPVSIYHRTRRNPGLAFCPICLATDEVPHYRRDWRLSFVSVCTRHHVELLDGCPKCTAPIALHRADVGPDGFAPRSNLLIRCFQCGYDFRRWVPQRADADLVDWTSLLEQAKGDGFVRWPHTPPLHSVPFFEGLRLAITAVVSTVLRLGSQPKTEFDRLPVASRRVVVAQSAKMLQGGSESVGHYMKSTALRYNDVVHSEARAPFWLVEQLMPFKRSQHPKRSTAEFEAIARVLEQRTGRSTVSLAKKEFNVDMGKGKAHTVAFRRYVSDDAYELLMASLDHDIAATFNQRDRQSLLQDKVMFGLARVLGWNCRELSALNVHEIRQVMPRPREVKGGGFEDAPQTREAICNRLWWHLENTRPKLLKEHSPENAFISGMTGRPLGDSAIAMRFTQAVERANLRASIFDLYAFRRGVLASAEQR